MMRILHAADIHLDSPLTGLRQRAGERGDELADATRRAFKKLVQYAIDEKAELLLISGDNWDGRHKDYNSLLFFAAEMSRVRHAGCQVVMLRGNHDAENQMQLKMPAGIHLLPTDRPDTILFEDLKVAVHGQSFPKRDVKENLAAKYPEPVSGFLNIGMLHTAVQNYAGAHTTYSPCTIDDLVSKGYDYWALGHVHRRTVISEKPWIVYPGNLQARHIKENGAKGATLVTVDGGAIAAVEHIPFDVVRWARTEIDATELETIDDLCAQFDVALAYAIDSTDGRALATRIVLAGRTSLHRAIKLEMVRLEAEAARAAEAAGDVWIEQIEVATEDMSEHACPEGQEDASAAVIAEAVLLKDGNGAREKLLAAIGDLPGKFSATLRKDAGLPELDEAALNAVIDDARDMLLAKLSA